MESMSKRVAIAEKLIRELSPEELGQFSRWFADFQDRIWERQIAADSGAGKLDRLIEKAKADHRSGLSKEL